MFSTILLSILLFILLSVLLSILLSILPYILPYTPPPLPPLPSLSYNRFFLHEDRLKEMQDKRDAEAAVVAARKESARQRYVY